MPNTRWSCGAALLVVLAGCFGSHGPVADTSAGAGGRAAAEDGGLIGSGGAGSQSQQQHDPDAQAPDAALEPELELDTRGCIDHLVRLSVRGGVMPSSVEVEVEACARYRVIDVDSNGREVRCVHDLSDESAITVDDIDALIDTADVQDAIAQAPVLFGNDLRASDGFITRIDIDGDFIDVGLPCMSSANCTEIPADVGALLTTLEGLVEQQNEATPDCLGSID